MDYIRTALLALGVVALFQFAAAEEYTFIAPEPWYSVDDPKSWSPAPEGAKAGTNQWLGGHTFIIAADQGTTGIAVKSFNDEEFPTNATFIFNKGFSLNFDKGNGAVSHTFGNIVNNAGALLLNAQTQLKMASLTLNPADSSTTAKFILTYKTPSDSYYYNSATDNFLAADLGRVTLNAASFPTHTWDFNQEFLINNSTSVNAVVRMNGLDGQGRIRNELSDVGNSGSTKIVFSNSSDAKFKGVICDDWGSKSNNTISIVMDGSAKQTLILTGTSNESVWTRDDKSQVGTTIKNGTLAISTRTDSGSTQLAKIQLDGGKLAVAESVNGGKGRLSTTGINWNGGKIALGLNDANLSAANIVSESGILQGEAEKFIFELDLSAFEPDKVFNGDEFQLISSSSGDFGYLDKYGATFIYNGKGLGDSLAYEFFVLNNTLGVKLTGTVPEPATVAAILGAAALAFAAYRRRK